MSRIFLISLFIFLFVDAGLSQSAPDSNTVIYGWKLDERFVTPERAEVDTNLVNFQLHNFMYRESSSNTTIGSNGSPYMSNLYFLRDNSDDVLFLNTYNRFLNTYNNTLYINSRLPFTHLQYIQSWPKTNREEYFNAFHSQNINKKLNVGFDVKIIADKAQYKYQNVNNKAFKVFSSYTGKNYLMHTSINYNKYFSGESGGVVDSSYNDAGWTFSKEVEMNFTGSQGSGSQPYKPNVTNRLRYLDGMLSQSIKLFANRTEDSLETKNTIAQPILSHVIRFRRTSKIYENTDPINNQYYRNIFCNLNETYDSIAESRVSNTIQLDFKTTIKKKVLAGVYANINHDFIKHSYYSLLDTALVDSSYYNSIRNDSLTDSEYLERLAYYGNKGITNYDTIYDINLQDRLNSVYVSAGIYGKFWRRFESRFSGTVYIAGYKAGQTKIDGLLNTNIDILDEPYELMVYGSIENIVPSYQLKTYYSNHYMWEGDFNSINRLYLSSKIAAPSKKIELLGHYTLLRNHIYFTEDEPKAHDKPISLSALTLQKEFIIWKFHSHNKLTYQVSENRSVIEIPNLVYFNSTYIDHTWYFRSTGGRLRTMLGVDIYYNSGFKGYDYMPALSMFQQNESSVVVGNYPYIDAWLNIRLKRTRFFFKYEHVNSSADNRDKRNSFYANGYPSKVSTFKVGISWTFYD